MMPLSKMTVIICFQATDPEYVEDNPRALSLIKVKDFDEKEMVMEKICSIIAEYKDKCRGKDDGWNYEDAIGEASDWLESNGYLVITKPPTIIERIDLD